MKTVDNESRLSRWSRRKQQTQSETQEEDLAEDHQELIDSAQLSESIATPVISEETDGIQTVPEAPVLTDADMPPIDALNSESDFSMFMSSGVTDKLRNLALKQLFKAPHFNIRDGLDEYDEDYTFFEKLGDIVTCDMKHQIEVETLKKEAAKLEADEAAALNGDVIDDEEGQDEEGQDEEGQDEEGQDEEGQDEEGQDEEGQDEEGQDEKKLEGNNPNSIQQDGDVYTSAIKLSSEGLNEILIKIKATEASVITKGESS